MKVSAIDKGVVTVKLRDPLILALSSTSATPQGKFKQAWVMTLLRRGHKCKLPRGFIKGNRSHIVQL